MGRSPKQRGGFDPVGLGGAKFGKDRITFRLEGVKESQRAFLALDDKLKRSVTRKAVNASVRPAVKMVRKLTPRNTGLLRRSITHRVKSYRKGGILVGVVGQRTGGSTKAFQKAAEKAKGAAGRGGLSGRGVAPPLHLVDQPVKAHKIKHSEAELSAFTGKEQGSLVWKQSGRVNYAQEVDHPGTSGKRFMIKAAILTRNQCLLEFKKKFKAEVTAAVLKVARKSAGGAK